MHDRSEAKMLDYLNELLRNHWLITTILTIVFAAVYHYVFRSWSFFSDRNVKFVRGWPLLGSTYRAVLGLEPGAISYQRCYEAFPNEKFIGIYEVFGEPTYLIRDPDLVKKMAITDFDHFVNHKAVFEKDVDPMVDRSLFFIHGERWRQMRATMSPNFTGSRMRAMHELILRYTNDFVATLKDLNDKNASQVYNTKALISKYANDIIATTAFGVEVNTLKDPENEFYKAGLDITNFSLLASLKFMGCLQFPKLMKALNIRLISDKSTNFMRHVVTENIEQRKKHQIVRNDFIDLMMKAKDGNQSNANDADDINIGFSTVEESTMKQQPAQKPNTGELSTTRKCFQLHHGCAIFI